MTLRASPRALAAAGVRRSPRDCSSPRRQARTNASGERRLGRLRQHAGRAPPLAADGDHARATSRSSAALYTVDFHEIDADRAPRRAVVSGRVERHALRDDERRQRLGARRDSPARSSGATRPTTSPSSRTSASSRTAASPSATARLRADARHDDRLARPGDRARSSSASRSRRPSRARRRTTATPRRARRSARTTALIVGAAGSEYGVRGFVMAYHTDLTPAWPNPFWTIPPAGTEWRRHGTLVGGGVVWTPTTVDTTTNTLYFGTGSATPLYFPSIRPGSNPRADSLIAVNLATGRMKWWQQQMAHNEWSYDTAQPPLVYNAKVGGKTRAHRLRRDDGGRLVRLRRRERPADLPARQGDRPHRAPGAQARQAGRRCSRRRSAA